MRTWSVMSERHPPINRTPANPTKDLPIGPTQLTPSTSPTPKSPGTGGSPSRGDPTLAPRPAHKPSPTRGG